jgi:hypothetical protein
MAQSMIVFDSLAQHGHGSRSKSGIKRWFEGMMPDGLHKGHVEEGGSIIRQTGEALLVGGLAGAFHASAGLDKGKIPLDAAGGAVALVAAMMTRSPFHRDGVSTDLRNTGASLMTIYAFRKAHELVAAKKRATGGVVAGELEAGADETFGAEDPIIAAARAL